MRRRYWARRRSATRRKPKEGRKTNCLAEIHREAERKIPFEKYPCERQTLLVLPGPASEERVRADVFSTDEGSPRMVLHLWTEST